MLTLPTGNLPAGLEVLAELALDLRWTWSHEADALWERVDAEAWSRTKNRGRSCRSSRANGWRRSPGRPPLLQKVERLAAARRAYLDAPAGFHIPTGPQPFRGLLISAWNLAWAKACHFMPAGSASSPAIFLKTASDLGVPIIGIGLLYQEGYFRQIIDAAGTQHEAYHTMIPGRCRFSRPRVPRAAGCISVSIYPEGRSNSASGKRRLDASGSTARCQRPVQQRRRSGDHWQGLRRR
jgi:glycogen phosphorylase